MLVKGPSAMTYVIINFAMVEEREGVGAQYGSSQYSTESMTECKRGAKYESRITTRSHSLAHTNITQPTQSPTPVRPPTSEVYVVLRERVSWY